MSRPKSLNISRSPNAGALILVPKYFYIWGINAIKIFLELAEGFWSYFHFSFFWNFEKFQFWDYLENLLRYVSVPMDKEISTHGKKHVRGFIPNYGIEMINICHLW